MIETFLAGAVAFGFWVAALFFFRFWRVTRDALFIAFSTSFFLLGVAQATLELAGIPQEQRPWVFVLRLIAFGIILAAIIRKNREA